MGWKLSNLPNGREDFEPVEQATAAPGEKRAICLHLLDADLRCERCQKQFSLVEDAE